MTVLDHIAYGVGVTCLCAMASAAVYTIMSTVAEHADQIRAALRGNPVRDRYEDAVAAVDADLRMICSVRWPA